MNGTTYKGYHDSCKSWVDKPVRDMTWAERGKFALCVLAGLAAMALACFTPVGW